MRNDRMQKIEPIESINIEEKILVDIYFHEVFTRSRLNFNVWSYVTRGFNNLEHHEFILTVRCPQDILIQAFKEKGQNFFKYPLYLFNDIYESVERDEENRICEASSIRWFPTIKNIKLDRMKNAKSNDSNSNNNNNNNNNNDNGNDNHNNNNSKSVPSIINNDNGNENNNNNNNNDDVKDILDNNNEYEDQELFEESAYFELKDWKGFVFGPIDDFDFKQLNLSEYPYLFCHPADSYELSLVENFGVNRFLNLLGKLEEYYPCPFWIDMSRTSLLKPEQHLGMKLNPKFKERIRILIPRIICFLDLDERAINIHFPLSQGRKFASVIKDLKPNHALIIDLPFNNDLDAYLSWNSENCNSIDNLEKLSFTRSFYLAKKIGGSLFTFIPEGSLDLVSIEGDIFVAHVKKDTFETLRHCFDLGVDFQIKSDRENGLQLNFTFYEPEIELKSSI